LAFVIHRRAGANVMKLFTTVIYVIRLSVCA
jgi:hypothetical protein